MMEMVRAHGTLTRRDENGTLHILIN